MDDSSFSKFREWSYLIKPFKEKELWDDVNPIINGHCEYLDSFIFGGYYEEEVVLEIQ